MLNRRVPVPPTPMSLRFVVISLCAVAAACASSGAKSGRRAACDLSPSDSVFALGRPVYRACGVDREARLLNDGGVRPDFSPSTMRSACYSVDLAFVVDSTGRPERSSAQIVRANDRTYAEAVLATIAAWRYEPAVRDGAPVRQIVTSHQSVATMVVTRPAGSPPPVNSRANSPRC